MKRIISFSIILFAFSLPIFSQTGSIEGKITDKNNGEIIFGAHVFVKQNGEMVGSITDPDGKYRIRHLNPGLYNLHISYQGKTKVLKGIEVHPNNISYAHHQLDPSLNMEEYVVEDFVEPIIDIDNPSMDKMDSRFIKKNPNKNNLKALITSSTPGITQSPDGDKLLVRGSRPNSTQYIIDGVKTPSGNLNIPGMAIGSINVYTGGIPAKYGDVTGGVIIVETKGYYDLLKERNLEK